MRGVTWGTYSDVMNLLVAVVPSAVFYLWATRVKLIVDGDRLHYRTIFGKTTVRLIDYDGMLGQSRDSKKYPIFLFWKDGRIVTIRIGRVLIPSENEELAHLFESNARLAASRTYQASKNAEGRALLLFSVSLLAVTLLVFNLHPLIPFRLAYDVISCVIVLSTIVPLVWISSVRIKIFDNNLNYHSIFKSYCLPLSGSTGSSHSYLIFEDGLGRIVRPKIWMISPQDLKALKAEIESL